MITRLSALYHRIGPAILSDASAPRSANGIAPVPKLTFGPTKREMGNDPGNRPLLACSTPEATPAREAMLRVNSYPADAGASDLFRNNCV
jgi:hypothetical protein